MQGLHECAATLLFCGRGESNSDFHACMVITLQTESGPQFFAKLNFKGAIYHRHRLGQVGLGLLLPRALLIAFLLCDSTFIKFCVYIFIKGTWSMITGVLIFI